MLATADMTLDHPIETDPRWTAFMARDASADGTFVAAVLITSIYCRPSCPARRPKPENVRLYAQGAEAERAGFRPCKRCRPDEPTRSAHHQALVSRACRTLENADEQPNLAKLARAAGMSPFHFHRIFKAITGVTPKAYADAERGRRMQAALTEPGTSVTDAIYQAGYGSNGRFYAAAAGVLGMTPTAFRNGGADTIIRFATVPCSLGYVLVAASQRGICSILLGDEPMTLTQDLRDRFPRAELIGGDDAFSDTVNAIVALLEDPGRAVELPLDIAGTAFQRRVWEALQAIPAGSTATYGDIAAAIGQPKAVRAVAGACAANKLAVAIPCHRVVHGSGAASGYRWGVDRKRKLLAREAGRRE